MKTSIFCTLFDQCGQFHASSPTARSGGIPGGAADGRPEGVVALHDDPPVHRKLAVRPEKPVQILQQRESSRAGSAKTFFRIIENPRNPKSLGNNPLRAGGRIPLLIRVIRAICRSPRPRQPTRPHAAPLRVSSIQFSNSPILQFSILQFSNSHQIPHCIIPPTCL